MPARATDAAAIAALQARGRFGVQLGLGRTRALLRRLGHPERDLRGPLIGGTNGKGSVQAMVGAVLRAAGLRVGQTPKPHLVDYRERIVVDGAPIAAAPFGGLIDEVLAVADGIPAALGPPTEFELLTAAAFTWFARQAVDVAVVEVGLGGRLDATNAWDGGAAVITNVDWDHMDRLGSTLARIGFEKAAIIKRGDRAVTGATGPGLQAIRRRAGRFDVPLEVVGPLPVRAMTRDGLVVEAPDLGELRVSLLGRHQAANAAVALATLRALDAAGIAVVDDAAIRRGLGQVRWPGRLELLPGDPEVLLDGAHNEGGAAALAAALDELRPLLPTGRPTVLFGVMADKAIGGIVAHLARAAALADARVIVTTPPSPRSAAAAAVAEAWRAAGPAGADVGDVE
ncbi:MAG: bifunctional folylpolyglutamate synthase/dihydrofolate synthase [Candidatus Limnocylindrales bacterium]